MVSGLVEMLHFLIILKVEIYYPNLLYSINNNNGNKSSNACFILFYLFCFIFCGVQNQTQNLVLALPLSSFLSHFQYVFIDDLLNAMLG
jgi:hypothetical protein